MVSLLRKSDRSRTGKRQLLSNRDILAGTHQMKWNTRCYQSQMEIVDFLNLEQFCSAKLTGVPETHIDKLEESDCRIVPS